MNKSTSIQIVFFLVMMLLVSTVFLVAQKNSPKTPPDGGNSPDRPEWQLALASDKKAASETIVAQLNAFDRNDYDAAAALQAPGEVRSSHEPEELRRLVQTFYPEFAHYKSVDIKEARANHSRNEMIVHIVLTGKDNYTVNAFYYIVVIGGRYLVGGVNGGEHRGNPFFLRRIRGPPRSNGMPGSNRHPIVSPIANPNPATP